VGFFLLVVMPIVGQRHFSHSAISSETREEWPLLTLETEMNGDSKSTNERGPSLVGSFGLVVPAQKIFVLPWLL
jgi:hypothetical protein